MAWNISIVTFFLVFSGQMIKLEEWNMILFIGVPVITKMKKMIKIGLFFNDMSLNDFSRYSCLL